MKLFVLAFFILGAAFVDIDEKTSKMGKKIVFRPIQWIFKHRGVLHSILAAVILSLIVGMFNLWGGFGFFVGYLSHLVLDSLTKSGTRLFWPLDFKIKGFIRTGKIFEQVFFVLLLLGNVFLVGKLVFNYLF